MTDDRALDRPAVSLSLPFASSSAALARQALVEWLRDRGADEGRVQDARLVASELVGNAVRHARGLEDGLIKIAWAERDGALEVAVSDGGSRTLPRQRQPSADEVDGRGLTIVQALAARWWVEAEGSAMTVRAILPG